MTGGVYSFETLEEALVHLARNRPPVELAEAVSELTGRVLDMTPDVDVDPRLAFLVGTLFGNGLPNGSDSERKVVVVAVGTAAAGYGFGSETDG